MLDASRRALTSPTYQEVEMADEFTPCSVGGCKRNAHWRASGKRGFCAAHYQRWRIHGDPLRGRTGNGSLETFLTEVAFNYDGDDCLLWPYGKSNNGYGTIRLHGHRKQFVHRLVCEHANGTPPTPKMDAAHACGNRICCNPRHLRWATREENMADAIGHGTLHNRRSNKLSSEDVLTIRKRLRSETRTDIARSFGVTFSCINDIASGKNWSWLS